MFDLTETLDDLRRRPLAWLHAECIRLRDERRRLHLHELAVTRVLDERGALDDTLAATDGVDLRDVHATLETARALESLPHLAAAAADGHLSPGQLHAAARLADTAAIAVRWPELADQAERFGVGAILAVPIAAGDVPVGTLTMYAPTGRGFSRDDERTAETIAEKAAVALVALGLQAASTEVRQLQEALRSRATIEQAKGILIALHRCSPDEAFARLTARSQHENRKLRDVAAALVAEHAASGAVRPRRRPPPPVPAIDG